MPSKIVALLCVGLLSAASSAVAQQLASPVLVVPFENAHHEARLHWLREASVVLLADALRDRGVTAIARGERRRAFEQLHLPKSASLTRATVIKIAQLVGAGDVVIGSFRLQGTELIVQARSIRVDAGRVQQSFTERGPLVDLFGIYGRLARRLALDAPSRGTSPPHPPLGAFESYVKGLVAETPAVQGRFLDAAIREHPSFDRARLALWEVRNEQGEHIAALGAVRGVQAESPLLPRARFLAAISLMNLERYEDAASTLTSLLDTVAAPPSDTGLALDAGAVHNNFGVLQIRRSRGEGAGATYYLTKAVELDPADVKYLFNLGYAYVLEQNHEGAVYWLREALRRDPADVDAHFVLAAALKAAGSVAEAAREQELARQWSARYAELERRAEADQFLVPRGLERIQTEPAGSRAFPLDRIIVSSAQREQKELAQFHLERGRRLFDQEQDTEAMAELRRAVYLSPYEAEAHLLIARILLRAGRPADAIDALKISIWSEESVAARVALGEAYLKSGDSAAARREAERALALDSTSVAAKRLMGQIR